MSLSLANSALSRPEVYRRLLEYQKKRARKKINRLSFLSLFIRKFCLISCFLALHHKMYLTIRVFSEQGYKKCEIPVW
jgi:hypothetical protein